jgi:hypothetical protein
MTLPQAKAMLRTEAPVIDLSPLQGGPPARNALAREIAGVCREVGFFYVINHGVPSESVRSMFEHAERFFSLPSESKDAIAMSRSRDYRGYLPIRMIGEGAGLKGNLYESFHVWPDCRREGAAPGRQPRSANVWPREMPQLEQAMLGYGMEVNRLAVELARIFASASTFPSTPSCSSSAIRSCCCASFTIRRRNRRTSATTWACARIPMPARSPSSRRIRSAVWRSWGVTANGSRSRRSRRVSSSTSAR